MFGLLKKQVLTQVNLKDASELSAIAKLASFAGEKLDLASLQLRAGFLASEAQGATIVADHIALTHASSDQLKQVETFIMTLDAPLAWGEDGKVDTIVAIVVPEADDSQAALAQVQANIQAHAKAFVNASAGTLEKLRRQL